MEVDHVITILTASNLEKLIGDDERAEYEYEESNDETSTDSSSDVDSEEESSVSTTDACLDWAGHQRPESVNQNQFKGIFVSEEVQHMLAMSSSEQNIFSKMLEQDQTVRHMLRRSSEPRNNPSGNIGLIVQTILPSQRKGPTEENGKVEQNPNEKLQEILCQEGVSALPRKYDSLESFFVKVLPEMIHAYEMKLVHAVRDNNLDALFLLLDTVKSFQCCNRFGESIVHLASRRGSTEALRFLVAQGVDVRVCCDSGRNPLHDGCWSSRPNFECIQVILDECPDLLLIQDRRGFTPLQYAPRDSWGEWNQFLDGNRSSLIPKSLT
jgi:hypothetical protein